MNSKRKTIIFVLVLFLSFLMISSSVLFTLKKIEIVSAKGIEIGQEEVLSKGNFKVGTNIFFVSKQKIKNNLEKSYPEIKVEKIEKKFPNKICFEFEKRQPIFCASSLIDEEQNNFLIDFDLKVLKKTTLPIQNNGYIVANGFDFANFSSGDFISGKMFFDFTNYLKMYGFNSQNIFYLSEICLEKNNIIIKTKFDKAVFTIFDVNKNLEAKIQLFASFCLNSNPTIKESYQIKDSTFGAVLI